MTDISAAVSTLVALVCASPLDDVVIVGVVNKFAPKWVAGVVVAVLFTASMVDMARRVHDWYTDDE